jgi:hypothetical protein
LLKFAPKKRIGAGTRPCNLVLTLTYGPGEMVPSVGEGTVPVIE